MKPNETIRFACGDCQIVFDICVAPGSEWADELEHDIEEVGEPTVCPFCGAVELKATHDRSNQSA